MVNRDLINAAWQELLTHSDEVKQKNLKYRKVTKDDMPGYVSYPPHLMPKIGDEIPYVDIPKTCDEAVKLVHNYFGQIWFGHAKYDFVVDYGAFTIPSIESELLHLNKFMTEAETLDYKDACIYTDFNKHHGRLLNLHYRTLDMFEYLRFKNGYYDTSMIEFEKSWHTKDGIDPSTPYPELRDEDKVYNLSIGASEKIEPAKVYGKYFLFYEFLKSKLAELKNQLPGQLAVTPQILTDETTLKEMFTLLTDYNKVIKLLKDDALIDDSNGIIVWIDKTSQRSRISGLLDHLCSMGYLKVGKITAVQKVAILKNTFSVSTTINTIGKPVDYNKYIKPFSFIPRKK
jgi:hypothetical protein